MWQKASFKIEFSKLKSSFLSPRLVAFVNLKSLVCPTIETRWMAFVSVGVGASQTIPLSVLQRNQHKGLAREISHETGRTREGRSPRSVSRRDRSREGHSQEKRAAETSRQNRSVKRWESGRKKTSQQKSERWLLRPVNLQMPAWATRELKSAFIVALWEFSLEYTRAFGHRMHKRCHRNPPSCTWS